MSELDLLERFAEDVKIYDPDLIVCHDGPSIIDLVLNRINVLAKSKAGKPRLSRLIQNAEGSKTNQLERVKIALAGRLLVDTFAHSKDMMKEVDYSLKSMSKYIKPEVKFNYFNEEETIDNINNNKFYAVLNAARE